MPTQCSEMKNRTLCAHLEMGTAVQQRFPAQYLKDVDADALLAFLQTHAAQAMRSVHPTNLSFGRLHGSKLRLWCFYCHLHGCHPGAVRPSLVWFQPQLLLLLASLTLLTMPENSKKTGLSGLLTTVKYKLGNMLRTCCMKGVMQAVYHGSC